MSHTIIDALDRVIPSLVQSRPKSILPIEETLHKYTNCLCTSRGDFPHQQLLMPDYDLTWSILDRDRSECSREVTTVFETYFYLFGVLGYFSLIRNRLFIRVTPKG